MRGDEVVRVLLLKEMFLDGGVCAVAWKAIPLVLY